MQRRETALQVWKQKISKVCHMSDTWKGGGLKARKSHTSHTQVHMGLTRPNIK